MRNTRTNRSNNITYQGIYNELEISKKVLDKTAYKNKTRTIRNHVKAILNEWKEEGYIIYYTENKEGTTLTGVTIML